MSKPRRRSDRRSVITVSDCLDPLYTTVSVLLILGRKCTLAASCASCWVCAAL